MLRQTRNALIYSDLALFVLDSREGITYNDVALYKWLNYHKMRLPSDSEGQPGLVPPFDGQTEEERYKQILKEEKKFMKAKDMTAGGTIMSDDKKEVEER